MVTIVRLKVRLIKICEGKLYRSTLGENVREGSYILDAASTGLSGAFHCPISVWLE